MLQIIDLNDTGKTKKLLAECAKNNGVFICRRPDKVAEKCLAYDIPQVQALGYNEVENFVFRDKCAYIDELEAFVLTLVPALKGYTLTQESK